LTKPHRRSRRTVQSYSPDDSNVLAPPGEYDWTCASLDPPESTTQTANRSVLRQRPLFATYRPTIPRTDVALLHDNFRTCDFNARPCCATSPVWRRCYDGVVRWAKSRRPAKDWLASRQCSTTSSTGISRCPCHVTPHYSSRYCQVITVAQR